MKFYILLLLSLNAHAEILFENNPFALDATHEFKVKFSELPTHGSVEEKKLAWPDYYWPSKHAVIASRWQQKNSVGEDWSFTPPTPTQLINMGQAEIDKLSPAEKYDIWNNRFDYPTVRMARQYGDPGAEEWHGICHGIAAASLNHSEPSGKTLTLSNGKNISFNSSDVKGLLGFYYAETHANSFAPQVGARCFKKERRIGRYIGTRFGHHYNGGNRNVLGRECNDIDAASFHIIMTNLLGIQTKSFIADLHRYDEVWNHAAINYQSEVTKILTPPRSQRQNGATRSLKIKTKVTFQSSEEPKLLPQIGLATAKWEKRTYHYYLHLNAAGDIIDGSWGEDRDEKSRPDFLWYRNIEPFKGHFEKLGELL